MEHKIKALVNGLGIGFLSNHKIQKYLISGELVVLAINKNAPDTPQYCSWRINNKGKAMRWFLNKILAQTELNSNP